ncbi:MAG: DUF3298 and DUF4163 domain-containing protein [Acetatifactor sp.]|nr:DUF3298 and DUF4163 domain-containing protein [Acetatifactor sp.]
MTSEANPKIPDFSGLCPQLAETIYPPSCTALWNSSAADASPFHSVPYFRDDTGKSIQSYDGFLYGYWDGQLSRYASDTLKQDFYFNADSNQSGQFCIYEDHIFFLEKPLTASLTGADTCLYMADLNRQTHKLLTSQVPNTTAEYSSYNNYDDYYEIDIYDDIIYLISDNFRENIYYRPDTEFRSVTRIGESETLYGLLPEGYREPLWYSRLPSLPYQMRHYGYLFLMDEDGNLAACDPESGRLESIDFPTDNIARNSVFLTNDALYCAEEADSGQPLTTWYRISLDDLHHAEEWGQFLPMQRYTGDDIFCDESGAYFAKREGSVVSLYQIPWDGSGITLAYSRYLRGGEAFLSPAYGDRYLCYTDGDYFYFNDKADSRYCVMRSPLHGDDPEPQIIEVYYEDLAEEIGTCDTLDHTFTVKTDVDGETESFTYHTVFTRFFLTGDTAGDHAVNAYLDNVYRDLRKELDSFETSYASESEFLPLPDGLGSYMEVTAWPSYLNDNYLGITIAEETYYSGGAHPNTWSEEYVFDRRTGKRIAITDIVKNSPEEICEIVALYIEKDHPGLHFYETPESRSGILEDFRFFLSEEGIGIHYNTYELGSYAEGNEDYVIPFWEFDLKPDTIMYLNTEKVRYRYYARLETKEPPLPSYMEALGNMLTERLKEGTLPELLKEHAAGCRELTFDEMLEKMTDDQNGVLKQYYISGKRSGDEWFCLEDSGDIWIRQLREQDEVPCWIYYRFPHMGDGYGTALDAGSTSEEFYFLAWEDTDYLVTVNRDSRGNISAVSTHCLLADTVYNGWILRHTLDENGEVSMECLCYRM